MEEYYINNSKYSFLNQKLTILQGCDLVGYKLPRFCYNEKLSVAGNCRMCLVEVINNKKLLASCSANLLNEMRVLTQSLRVRRAQESILELLLANHPLDCPICDQVVSVIFKI